MSLKEFILSNRDYFEDFITRSTHQSNAIEGNTLSYAETYAILFNDNSLKITAQPREIYEAINLKYAMNYVIKSLDEPLSEQLIQSIGIMVNKNINEIDGSRREQVFIRGAEHIPPAANMVKTNMMYFVYNYNNTSFNSPFHKAANKHIEFERIHPFGDGNGRTGRLLINYEMLKNNLPPVIIPAEERTKYFKMLADVDEKGLSEFFMELSHNEKQRLKQFGYETPVIKSTNGRK